MHLRDKLLRNIVENGSFLPVVSLEGKVRVQKRLAGDKIIPSLVLDKVKETFLPT